MVCVPCISCIRFPPAWSLEKNDTRGNKYKGSMEKLMHLMLIVDNPWKIRAFSDLSSYVSYAGGGA